MTEDKKEKKLFSFELDVLIYAKPDSVFEAMTDADIMSKWMEGESSFEQKVTGKISLFDGWVSGEVLEFEPGISLAYSWKPNTWKKNLEASIVQMDLEEHEAGTKLVLSHRGFPTEKEAADHREGWFNYFFDPMNDFFTEQM